MKLSVSELTPVSLRGYQTPWLSRDVIAGATLAAVAIPEVMGYTSIAQTPLVTGLYTIIFPALAFALFGASKLLVVGADSATAAVLAAGLGGLTISGLTPYSPEWVAYCGLTALVCGVLLVFARLLKLGFIGDFLSASVLIGFLTGVGIQVLTGQIPGMLGVPKGTGSWFQQQIDWIKEVPNLSWPTFAFAIGTVIIIIGFKKFVPKVPGALIAVILSIVISTATDASAHGVSTIGAITGGFPPIGLPSGVMNWDAIVAVFATAVSCFILIIAQSAATSRSFAMKHGERVDVNRDIVGLSAASIAAGLTGTFVVNGSPTKTQILDENKGRTQVANMTMSVIALLFVMYFTSLLKNMPHSVLAAIVFLIGVDLIDIKGLRGVLKGYRIEFYIAIGTAVIVFAVGVEQGIIAAIVLSLLDVVRRQYKPSNFVVGVSKEGEPTYTTAAPGTESLPGLIVFKYDADLFYANANRFVDDVEALVDQAPSKVRWVILDAGSVDSLDFSAGIAFSGLLDYLDARSITFAVARMDSSLETSLTHSGALTRIPPENVFGNLIDAVHAFEQDVPVEK
jgi:MFS superfamily sulfate permease-like transporter